VPHQTTYYSEQEYSELQRVVEDTDKSFSEAVRDAIQEYYEV